MYSGGLPYVKNEKKVSGQIKNSKGHKLQILLLLFSNRLTVRFFKAIMREPTAYIATEITTSRMCKILPSLYSAVVDEILGIQAYSILCQKYSNG